MHISNLFNSSHIHVQLEQVGPFNNGVNDGVNNWINILYIF